MNLRPDVLSLYRSNRKLYAIDLWGNVGKRNKRCKFFVVNDNAVSGFRVSNNFIRIHSLFQNVHLQYTYWGRMPKTGRVVKNIA